MRFVAAIESLFSSGAATAVAADSAVSEPPVVANVPAPDSVPTVHVVSKTPERRFVPAWLTPPRPLNLVPTPPQMSPSAGNKQNARDRFALVQAVEQFCTYGVAGVLEGMGKFFQRSERDRYFDNPMANWFFGPLHASALALADALGVEPQAMEAFFKSIGSIGMSAGNALKVGTNAWAWGTYRKLAREVSYEKIQKAAFGNSWRNVLYLIEKGGFTLAGASYAAGYVSPAVAAMVVVQAAVLVNAATTLDGNKDIIAKYVRDPDNLRMARDAAKITALNSAKGLWALTTLGALAYTQLPEEIKQEVPFALPECGSADATYHVLVQANWELPQIMILLGIAFMVLPPALSFALHTKHALIAPDKDIANGARTDRTYHMLGATADVCNGIGGFYLASLFWHPLGAVFNGLGSLFSLAQDRRKAWLNRAAA